MKCNDLKFLRLPPSVRSCGDYAFVETYKIYPSGLDTRFPEAVFEFLMKPESEVLLEANSPMNYEYTHYHPDPAGWSGTDNGDY